MRARVFVRRVGLPMPRYRHRRFRTRPMYDTRQLGIDIARCAPMRQRRAMPRGVYRWQMHRFEGAFGAFYPYRKPTYTPRYSLYLHR